MNHWSRSCRTEPHLVQMYQEWKKREKPEAHFIQARVDAVTGEHTVVLPQPVEKQREVMLWMLILQIPLEAISRMTMMIITSMKRTFWGHGVVPES